MPRYAISGLVIDSALALPELEAGDWASLNCKVQLVEKTLDGRGFVPRVAIPHPLTGETWLEYVEEGRFVHLRFQNLAAFSISRDGREIECAPEEGLPPEVLRRLLVAQVLPRAWSLQGRTVLHASAVVLAEGGAAFCGASGQGKSTLAGAFGREGCPVLADDGLLLEERSGTIVAFPGYPRLRLFADSFTTVIGGREAREEDGAFKTEVPFDAERLTACREPASLRAFYSLERGGPDAAFEIRPLSIRNAYIALLENAFHLDLSDNQGRRRYFERYAGVARLLPARRLRYPSSFSRLAELTRAIREDLRGLVSGPRALPGA